MSGGASSKEAETRKRFEKQHATAAEAFVVKYYKESYCAAVRIFYRSVRSFTGRASVLLVVEPALLVV